MAFFRGCYSNIKTLLINRLSILFLFFSVSFFNGRAQIHELRLKYFTKEEGLSNLNINHIAQDSTGFIWIATNNGLFKYDGYNFTGYYSNQYDSITLSNSNISYLFTDSKSRLWIGSISGLCRYNNELDNFERFYDFNRFIDIVDKNVMQISEDKNGNILISCNNYIFKFDQENKKFLPLLSIKKGKINHFLVDKSNSIWIACSENQGLKKFNLLLGKWEIILPDGDNKNDLTKSSISHLSLGDGKLWMATLGEGIKMLDINSHKVAHYHFGKGDAKMVTYTYIDNKKNIWCIDYTGLKKFDRQTGTFVGIYPKSLKKEVKGIFQDKQGNYWVYHGPRGLGISMALKGFGYFENDLSKFWHTSDENISALQEDSKGNLWIGNNHGGISVFKYQQHAILKYKSDELDKFSIGKGGINFIFRDRSGTIWLSSYYGGLQFFDEKMYRFISYKNNPDDLSSISGNDIRSIAEDNEGNLWLAVHGKGVDKFDRKHSKFFHYNGMQNNLAKDWTYQVLFDYRGNLWVATSWGLSCLKNGETLFNNYYSKFDDSTSLSNSFINTIYEDENHVLWIGTEAGLNKYNPDTDNFTRYDKIFNNNNISGILSDNDNNLWISTLSGLAMFDQKNKKVKNFGLPDGLITDEFNPRSCYKTHLNELFFGGTNGIVRFKPNELVYNTIPPFVFIEKIKILNKELKIGGADYGLQKDINLTRKIVLNHSDNIITIKYKALNFINPQLNQYAYRLEGFDPEEKGWHFAGNTREATYTNLDAGTYTFKVIASNNDGYWNYEGASFEIIILPPWWHTWWFRSVAAMLLLSSLYIAHYARLSFYRNQQKRLNALVKERTTDLEKTTLKLKERQDEINQQNEELKVQHDEILKANNFLIEKQQKIEEQNRDLDRHQNELELMVNERTRQYIEAKEKAEESDRLKSSFLANLSHEIRTPLNAIIGFSRIIANKNKSDEEKLLFSQYIRNSGDTLLNLIDDIIDLSKIEAGHVDITLKDVLVLEIFNELSEIFKVQLSKNSIGVVKSLKLKMNVDQRLLRKFVKTDPLRLKQILNNLMSNAIKFTNKGFIELGCILQPVSEANFEINQIVEEPEQLRNELLFYVKDTGIGISKENIKIIFERFRKVEDDNNNLYRGTGLGLAISEQLVNLLGGKIWAESEINKGTTFYFTHPFLSAI